MFDLVEDLENTLIIEGEEYKFDLSFDVVIRFYELLEDKNLKSFEKINKAFDLFYFDAKAPISDFTFEQKQAAIEEISNYIQKCPYGNNNNDQESGDTVPEKLYSYSQDAGAIYASFFADYGIDLLTQRGKMHYLTFKALLAGLSEKTHFQRILSIRSRSVAGLEGESLTNLLELQQYYALESEKSVDNLDNQLGSMFDMLAAQAQSNK
ncbi:Gp15 family bacteriophage protein [Enterococcus faecium]|uniref:Gp15 family bacteriophage protein n=1 Tax=Enterococcus faecium TaxID=1352 RepID=UPI002073B21D|nr:Gp15 family bacteriophage protein [Enterococcus faecium]